MRGPLRLTAWLAAAALLLFAAPEGGRPAARAADSETELRLQIQALEEKANRARADRADLQVQLDALRGQTGQALAEKALLDRELSYLDRQIEATLEQIACYDELADQKEADLAAAQAAAERQFTLFCCRARAMEEQGTVSYWSVLFSAESFSDMLDLFTIVSDTIDYDNGVIEACRAAREAQQQALDELNTVRGELAAKKAELDGHYAQQREKVSQAAAVLAALEEDEAALAQAIAAEEESAAAIDRAIREKEGELAELIRLRQITTGEGYVWPLRGYYTLTSAYGYRNHPVFGNYRLHNGLDIGAPKGTPIHAAKGGIVRTSGRDSSYGEYVVIVHADGNSTLYAHMSKRAVKEGDTVAQDQVIGYVGMTGTAQGYHLHLEIRENGARVDPHDVYVGSVPFKYASTYDKNAVKP